MHHQCPTLCSRKRPPGATQKASNTRSKTQEETLCAANATTIGLTIIRFQGDFKLPPFLSHVSGGAWNATPFWQLKIQPRNGVHSVDALVLYGNTIYSVRGILFNGIKPRQNRTGQTLTRVHAIHTAPLFHQITRRHKHLFTNHRQIPIDQIPSHG